MTFYFYAGLFSQFHRAPVLDSKGRCFTCNEQYMMAHKALLMGDRRTFDKIIRETHPKKIQRLGRRVTPWNQAKWDAHKYDIVLAATRAKVEQHPYVRRALLDTGAQVIAEASPRDRIWGIGLSQKDAEAGEDWRGTNLLGEAWMQVRSECYPTLVVPYRATNQPFRAEQLERFRAHMAEHLPLSPIVVAEQADDGRLFNRGALLNLGVSKTSAPLICLHDVDLLPGEDVMHTYLDPLPLGTVRHIGRAWKRYDADSYLGGILLLRKSDYVRVNGFPNDFWGWGGEDDELRDRLEDAGVRVQRVHEGTVHDLESKTLDEKLAYLRRHKLKCPDKWEKRDAHRQKPSAKGFSDTQDYTNIGRII